MIRGLASVLGYRLAAKDGEIGQAYDFFIDDSRWRVRHLVVEIGNWLNHRRLLVPASDLGSINDGREKLTVDRTRDEVLRRPDVDAEMPVSRQKEIFMSKYYAWPTYRAPASCIVPEIVAGRGNTIHMEGDSHLRSFREIASYSLRHGAETVAMVHDFAVDDADWSLESLVAVPRGWFHTRLVAVPLATIDSVSWQAKALTTSLSKQSVEKLPSLQLGRSSG